MYTTSHKKAHLIDEAILLRCLNECTPVLAQSADYSEDVNDRFSLEKTLEADVDG